MNPNQPPTDAATPRSWSVGKGEWHQLIAIYDSRHVFTASAHIGHQDSSPVCIPSRTEAIANAVLIVRAVNLLELHEKAVIRLKQSTGVIESMEGRPTETTRLNRELLDQIESFEK